RARSDEKVPSPRGVPRPSGRGCSQGATSSRGTWHELRQAVPPIIDLHMHTQASDGRQTAEELVRRAREVGITILSVTDHDTTASVSAAAAAAATAAIGFVP